MVRRRAAVPSRVVDLRVPMLILSTGPAAEPAAWPTEAEDTPAPPAIRLDFKQAPAGVLRGNERTPGVSLGLGTASPMELVWSPTDACRTLMESRSAPSRENGQAVSTPTGRSDATYVRLSL
jgi:hypothetical protein